jgi:hypothetical protein
MPEETRVFDVSKPGRASPSATSKPVIVGHHPMNNDPMVRTEDSFSPIPITVHDGAAEDSRLSQPGHFAAPAPSESDSGIFTAPQEPEHPAEEFQSPQADSHSVFPSEHPAPAPLDVPPDAPARVEELHMASAKKRRKPLMWTLLTLLVLLAGAYLFIDSNVVDTGINLPFHVFKQKTKTPIAAPTTNPSQLAAPTVPAGFTEYKLSGTSITFAAPTAWGAPSSTADSGYSVRGGTNKPDGTYAYLVDFTTNKDVEIAVTSSKYLPPARGAAYYDFLQWCTGTNDSKFYRSVLHFSTAADKTDTPTTITCDNGPLSDATKLNATTIVQLNMKSADGKTAIGDLYTKNLASNDLTVFRIKDAKSASGDDIKKLILTIKSPSGNAAVTAQSP